IYASSMQNSINNLIGNNVGNTSEVGAAGVGSTQESLGGGYDIGQIYRRDRLWQDIYRRDTPFMMKRDIVARGVEQMIQRRDLANSSQGYNWYGSPVGKGLP